MVRLGSPGGGGLPGLEKGMCCQMGGVVGAHSSSDMPKEIGRVKEFTPLRGKQPRGKKPSRKGQNDDDSVLSRFLTTVRHRRGS